MSKQPTARDRIIERRERRRREQKERRERKELFRRSEKIRRSALRKSDPTLRFMLQLIVVVTIILGGFGLQEAAEWIPVSARPFQQTAATPTPSPDDTERDTAPSIFKVGLDPLAPIATPTARDPAAVLRPTSPADVPTPISSLATNDPQLATALQKIINEVGTRPGNPGVAMYIETPEKGTWAGASGYADRKEKRPVAVNDRFRIASLTKMFVATIVLQLVEEETLSLDDTVEEWLPGVVPNGSNITLHHLLSHTSGLYDYLDYVFESHYFAEDPLRVWLPHEMVAHGVSNDPYFAPGEAGKWHYSNTNYILLGMIIEQATDSSLRDQLHRRIIEPLGLHNTYLEDYDEVSDGPLLDVHGYIGDSDYTHASLSAWAAGGIVSNVHDVAVFGKALFEGDLLSEEMRNRMLTPVRANFIDAENYPIYGLGVAQNVEALALATMGASLSEMHFQAVWGHIGGLSGFKSVLAYKPEEKITFVLLTNQMTVGTMPIMVETLNLLSNGG